MAIIEKDAALVSRLRAELLAWYDNHGRDLPWRHGGRDPYRVWLSEVMLQQTTTAHAAPYYARFLELWPTVADLAAAADGEVMAQWAGLGYYARARRLLECARTVERDHAGRFPDSEAELLKLPGFGPYTAAAVAAIAFDRPANVVDGNIERIMARLYAIPTPLPAGRTFVREAAVRWVRDERAGDWPQALMDLANQICRPKSPLCLLCPLNAACDAFRDGKAESYPVKAAKVTKPRRYGVVFVVTDGVSVIVERREAKGLLGGMLGLPHTQWRAEPWQIDDVKPMFDLGYSDAGRYEHVFTHFALTQQVWIARVGSSAFADFLRHHNGWQALPLEHVKALPTVFTKALKSLLSLDHTPA
ncbi:A/G-specific adenine glycosylase [Asticcacaulis sp. AC402]|uniref:A/G-specific adenine glycosylase n=1 Tax=Asticcacaulis sp. AC402 TaxID=1282361 RepID=UPI0003C3D932|nr:A/G-specific adenine glycosylase [Asticcacaulis sp. AC402]ESQ76802.1 adenine glycosylase [Asticcacaulis sp. AC402]